MSKFQDKITSPPVSGFVKITSSDGRESSFSNYIMRDHYKVILNALIGDNNGEIGVFGAGTSTSLSNAKDLSEMTSKSEPNSSVSYAMVTDRDPVNSISNLDADLDLVPEYIQDNTAAVAFSGSFGSESDDLDGEKIAEIAIFADDKDAPKRKGQMFARTIIPEEERLEKFPTANLNFLWLIYYGFQESEFKYMNQINTQ